MKKYTVVLLAFLLILSLTGCFQKQEAPEDKIYLIATPDDDPPYAFFNQKNNLKGLDIDLLTKISDQQHLHIQLQVMGREEALAALDRGEVDGVMSHIKITEKRKEVYDFTDPYYSSGISLAVHKNSLIKTYQQLARRSVAIVAASASETYADSILGQYGFTKKSVNQRQELYDALNNRQVNAIFDDAAYLKYAIKTSYPDFVLVGDIKKPGDYGLAVKKGSNTYLLETFNKGLAQLKEKGTYDKIIARYQ